MAETSEGAVYVLKTLLGSAAAGFAFGEVVSFAVAPALIEDVSLLNTATLAARRAGLTGVAVVMACLVFTSALLSLGMGFLLCTLVLKLLNRTGFGLPVLTGITTGTFVTVGAVAVGVLVGVLPTYIYLTAQGTLVIIVYSYSNINDMTTALLIIFTTLYVSVFYGQMGALLGLFCSGLTIPLLFILRKTLSQRLMQRAKSKNGCRLLERIFFYSVFVGILGFFVGLGAGGAGEGSKAEMVLMLQSVLWVAFLAAGLLGAGLGTVAIVGLGPEVAGNVAIGAAVATSVALRAILQWSSSLGARSCTAATLGAATAAGISLGAASVAAKQAFKSRNFALAVLGCVIGGLFVALKGVALKAAPLTTSEHLIVTVVAVGAFFLGAPKSPFHTQVNLQKGLLTGAELINGLGIETVTAAAAPIGAGALGAAALGTAALGTLGTVGVLVAVALALGGALSGMIGKSPPAANKHRADQ